jgi:O-antigen/teichoic acid export membrane protein
MSRLLVRRSATAIGIYSSFLFGILGTVVASRELPSVRAFGDYSTIVFAIAFVQSFFDLTAEEALVKYGFRYIAREDWGRLGRLFASGFRAKAAGSLAAGAGLLVFAAVAPSRLVAPLLLAAAVPLGQSLEGFAGIPFYLRGRYDVRAAFQAWSMLLRLSGIVVGARYGVSEAIAGILVAQAVATASIAVAGRLAYRAFPVAEQRPLAEDRREILRFVLQSSTATGVISLRTGLAPLLLGVVSGTTQVGLFRVAQAPQTTFSALSSPARMVLLTEQTRDWEHGRQSVVLRGVRRYSLAAFAIALVSLPPLLVLTPDLIRLVNGARYVPATGATRLFILAAGLQLLVGWSKSFAVTVGRPALRVWTHGLEALIVLPLVLALGAAWGAAGAAGAVLAGTAAYAVAWAILFLRITPDDGAPVTAGDAAAGAAEIEAEAGVLAR